MNNFNLSKKRQQMYAKNKRRKIIKLSSIPFLLIISATLIILKFTTIGDNSSSEILFSSYEEDLFTVCIDAGHGEWDLGASGTFADEKDITLAVALELGALLEASDDVNVIYTRKGDSVTGTTSAESLQERVKISNNANADLFISIHCNSYPDNIYVDGVETWYDPNDENSKYFATLVQNELSALDYTYDRGILTYEEGDELYVINNTNATAILVELGFISNPYDEEYLSTLYGQAACAEAMYNAIIDYIALLNTPALEEGYNISD